MVTTTAASSSSLKEYLKKYEINTEEEKKKKKKKKKSKNVGTGVLVVDEDPVWQKPVNLEQDEQNDSPDEKPVVDEDIDVKRMRRLEQLRVRHAQNRSSEDGSGWVSVSDVPRYATAADASSDISPPRQRRARYDTPSPECVVNPSYSGGAVEDLSPPRKRRARNYSPSPDPGQSDFRRQDTDLSPPRKRRARNDSPSPDAGPSDFRRQDSDLSPPRRRRGHDGPPSENKSKSREIQEEDADLSPPRRRGKSSYSPSPAPRGKPSVSAVNSLSDLSPPRRVRRSPSRLNDLRGTDDLSPPRKSRKGIEKIDPNADRVRSTSSAADLSPPRKKKEQRKTGLITGKDVNEEITKTKAEEWSRFKQMDPSVSGRGAEPVYRIKGEKVTKDEYLKLTKKKEEKPKEDIKLEWGKGLAQKREAEARLEELELEKEKPFARTRDDPELDNMMKERVRWGDPMAHLVKKKQYDAVLPNLGADEKMKESGFIIPQEIPSHSWLKRGLDFEPNRYGIRPGRHWDGVNRSNGYEKQLFKRTNEKQATEKEAYLWSVADM